MMTNELTTRELGEVRGNDLRARQASRADLDLYRFDGVAGALWGRTESDIARQSFIA